MHPLGWSGAQVGKLASSDRPEQDWRDWTLEGRDRAFSRVQDHGRRREEEGKRKRGKECDGGGRGWRERVRGRVRDWETGRLEDWETGRRKTGRTAANDDVRGTRGKLPDGW